MELVLELLEPEVVVVEPLEPEVVVEVEPLEPEVVEVDVEGVLAPETEDVIEDGMTERELLALHCSRVMPFGQQPASVQ